MAKQKSIGPTVILASVALAVAVGALIVAGGAALSSAGSGRSAVLASLEARVAALEQQQPAADAARPNSSRAGGFTVANGESPIPLPGEDPNEAVQPGDPIPGVRPFDDTPAPVVPWDRAKDYLGQRITAEGEIVDTGAAGRMVFLNFVAYRPGSTAFAIPIYPTGQEGLPDRGYFKGKTVRVTGDVSLHQGDRPQIQVKDPRQIQVLIDGQWKHPA